MNKQENYFSHHPLLSLTRPEAPSLIHIQSLNQHNIECCPTTTLDSSLELAILKQNIYGTVTNQVIDFSGIYKKIVAGDRRGDLQDTYL